MHTHGHYGLLSKILWHLNIFVETLLQETGKPVVTLWEKKKYNRIQTAQDMLKLVRSKVKINLFLTYFVGLDC